MHINRIEFILKFGIALILLGSLDPMEGSILINLGSVSLSYGGWKLNKTWKWWSILATIFISTGVISLWSVSSLGGFDPHTEWWWLLAILPYPVGWLGVLGSLLMGLFRRLKMGNF